MFTLCQLKKTQKTLSIQLVREPRSEQVSTAGKSMVMKPGYEQASIAGNAANA